MTIEVIVGRTIIPKDTIITQDMVTISGLPNSLKAVEEIGLGRVRILAAASKP